MEEIELSKQDLKQIFEYAHRLFTDQSTKGKSYDNFLCYCISMSFIQYATAKKWMIVDGKIYKSPT